MLDTPLAALVGLAQGMRHALEPDHVAAIATIVVGRVAARTSVAYAAAWGLGHGLVLVLVGGACASLGWALPERVSLAFEMLVAAMLLWLGFRAIVARKHAHAHAADPASPAPLPRPSRAIVIGCVHGAAGTGPLVAIALAGGGSRAASVAGLSLYALGAAVGMMLLAGALGPAIAKIFASPRASRVTTTAAGAFSMLLGVFWGARTILALL